MWCAQRFCLEWIEGDVSEDEVIGQLAFLRMPEKMPDMVGVIRWPEQSKGKVFLLKKIDSYCCLLLRT